MPAIKKAFDLMGDDIVEISTENETLKNRIGSCDEKRLEESKAKSLKRFNDETTANLFIARKGKQTKKQYFYIGIYILRPIMEKCGS